MAPSPPVDPSWLARLSNREEQVLALAADGLLDKQIAATLGVTENTLRTYWRRIRTKLGDGPRTALAAIYIRRRAAAQVEEDGEWSVDLQRSTIHYQGVRSILPPGESDLASGLRSLFPDDRDRMMQIIRELSERDSPPVVVVVRINTPRGMETINSLVEAVRDSEGRVIRLQGRHVPIIDLTSTPGATLFGTYRRDLTTNEVEIDEGLRRICRIPEDEQDIREAVLSRFCEESKEKMRHLLEGMLATQRSNQRWTARLCFENGDKLWVSSQSRVEMKEGRPALFVSTVVAYR